MGEHIGRNANGDNVAESSLPSGNFVFASTVLPASCPADLTGDGELDFFDVAEFLEVFGDQDPVADFSGDGMFDFFDVADFLDAFAPGCP